MLFTKARLLTTTEKQGPATYEVSHEALIRSWPRLTEWLHDAHDGLYLQKRLREDIVLWNKLEKPITHLYDDERLTEALAWQKRALLSQEEEAFLAASS